MKMDWKWIAAPLLAAAVAIGVACWTRYDTKREASGVAYAEVLERVVKVEDWKDYHQDMSAQRHAELVKEIEELQLQLVGYHSVAVRAGSQAEAAKEASETSNAMLIQLLHLMGMRPPLRPQEEADRR